MPQVNLPRIDDAATQRAFRALNIQIESLTDRIDELESNSLVSRAEAEILATYGDTVSVAQKRKSLAVVGRSNAVGTSLTQMWRTGGTETLPTGNTIDRIVSTTTDTQDIVIEGATLSAGALTFVSQTATLTGATPVTLATPLARVFSARVAATETTALAGDVTVYVNAGATHATIKGTSGENRTYKGAYSTANDEYLIITTISGSIADKVSGLLELDLEDAPVGGVFDYLDDFTVATDGSTSFVEYLDPPILIPKNHDIRLMAKADGASTDGLFRVSGYLAKVTS